MRISVYHRGSAHFLTPLLDHWEANGWTVDRELGGADVIWVEWANEQSVRALSDARRRNVVVRMLGSEYWQEFWRKWDLSKLHTVVQSSGVTVIPGVRWECIPPGIDANFWMSNYDGDRDNRLIVVGSFTYTKNHVGLLRVLADRPLAFDEVMFVGPLDRDGRPGPRIEARKIVDLCRRYADRYGINLVIHDRMSRESLRDLYCRSALMVCPAINSFSAVVGEAMACECKVLVADWPGSWVHWPERIIYSTEREFWSKWDNYPMRQYDLRRWVVDRFHTDVVFERIDRVIREAARVV